MALDRGGQIERGGILRHVDRLDRAGIWGAGNNDREDRQQCGGADETQTSISKCKGPAELTRAAPWRRHAGERQVTALEVTAIQVTAIQHYVYFAARRFQPRGFAARGRRRAEGARQREKAMNAGAAHGVSTILPI
jgi:hypothetical protein